MTQRALVAGGDVMVKVDVAEIRARAEAARRPRLDVGYHGDPLLHVGAEDRRGIVTIYYGDGDGCAEVYGHLAFGISANDMAELFTHAPYDVPALCDRVAELERALAPFAEHAGVYHEELPDARRVATDIRESPLLGRLTVGAFRAAAAALATKQEEGR